MVGQVQFEGGTRILRVVHGRDARATFVTQTVSLRQRSRDDGSGSNHDERVNAAAPLVGPVDALHQIAVDAPSQYPFKEPICRIRSAA